MLFLFFLRIWSWFGEISTWGGSPQYIFARLADYVGSLITRWLKQEVAVLMVRDHDVEDYAVLPDMDTTDVGVLTDDDRDCLNALGEYLLSTSAWRRFAIWLLHKHFEPAPGEVFVERIIAEHRQTRTTLIPRAAFPCAGLLATAMRFDAASKTSLGVVGMEFAVPADLGSAVPVSPADEAVLAGLAEILQAHHKADRFGFRLIRDRLGLSDDEVLLETCDVDARTLHSKVIDPGALSARSFETSWQWQPVIAKTGPTPVMTCQVVSWCTDRASGGHEHHEQHHDL